MKNKFLITVVLLSISILSWGQVSNTERIAALEHQISSLQNETWQYKNDLMRQLNALKKDKQLQEVLNIALHVEDEVTQMPSLSEENHNTSKKTKAQQCNAQINKVRAN